MCDTTAGRTACRTPLFSVLPLLVATSVESVDHVWDGIMMLYWLVGTFAETDVHINTRFSDVIATET